MHCIFVLNESLFLSKKLWKHRLLCITRLEFEGTKMGNQKPYIEEEQTTQWSKKTDKQRSTKHTQKTEDRGTRTLLKTGDELRCSGRVISPYSTSDTVMLI